MNNVFKTIGSWCLVCGHVLDRAAAMEKYSGPPRKGDVTICINCGAFLTYTEDSVSLKLMTENDLGALDHRQQVLLLRARDFIEKRGRIK